MSGDKAAADVLSEVCADKRRRYRFVVGGVAGRGRASIADAQRDANALNVYLDGRKREAAAAASAQAYERCARIADDRARECRMNGAVYRAEEADLIAEAIRKAAPNG